MNHQTHKELAIHALKQIRGDDLARAKLAFRNCTEEQMQELYGQSGRTRAQILENYEAWETRIQAAIEWVKIQN